MTIDGKPAANLDLQSYDPDDSVPVVGQPRLVREFRVKTDADGHFELPRVLPGRLTLAQWVPNGVDRRVWPVIRASLDVEGGRSYDLKIGTSGRLVSGRLVLPRAETWMIRKAEIVSKGAKSERSVTVGVEVLEGGRFPRWTLKLVTTPCGLRCTSRRRAILAAGDVCWANIRTNSPCPRAPRRVMSRSTWARLSPPRLVVAPCRWATVPRTSSSRPWKARI